MSEFTASNGVSVWINSDGTLETSPAGAEQAQALREFFQAEEDKRLGRWRWPENPDYVVYRDHGAHYIDQPAVIVVNETTGGSAYAVVGSISASGVGACDDGMLTAVQAYFDAHPEPKPEWHDSKPGSVWELTVGGVASAYVAYVDRFIHVERQRFAVDKDDPEITAGRCVWRAGDES